MHVEPRSSCLDHDRDCFQTCFPEQLSDCMMEPGATESSHRFWEIIRDTPNDQVKGAMQFLLACWIVRDDVLAHRILTCTHPVDNGSSVLYHDKKFVRVAGLLFLVKLELHQHRMVAPQCMCFKVFECCKQTVSLYLFLIFHRSI